MLDAFKSKFMRNLNLRYLLSNGQWSIVHVVTVKICSDIFGEGADYAVVIELDKHRADQVAKKFVRASLVSV